MMGHVLRAFTSAAIPKHHDFKAIGTVTPHVTNAGTPNQQPQVHRPLTTASSKALTDLCGVINCVRNPKPGAAASRWREPPGELRAALSARCTC